MNILFIDNDCPSPVDFSELDARPLGGTEGTLLRVAQGLAGDVRCKVMVAQHNRRRALRVSHNVLFLPYVYGEPLPAGAPQPDVVVVLRNFKIIGNLRRQFPRAQIFLWMHCYPGKRWKRVGCWLSRHDVTVIAVSQTLRRAMVELLQCQLPAFEAESRVVTLYNPVPIPKVPRASVDPDKLVFFSSPHKGIEEVYENFAHVRRLYPSMKLYVADPGYWRGPGVTPVEGVVSLGALPPSEVHRHVASALCVFYAQTRFAETFGLVFAEANALGTPVLAHPLGAAAEVLNAGARGQITDCSRVENVTSRVARWRSGGRPRPCLHPRFHLPAVLERWNALLRGGPQKHRLSAAADCTAA